MNEQRRYEVLCAEWRKMEPYKRIQLREMFDIIWKHVLTTKKLLYTEYLNLTSIKQRAFDKIQDNIILYHFWHNLELDV